MFAFVHAVDLLVPKFIDAAVKSIKDIFYRVFNCLWGGHGIDTRFLSDESNKDGVKLITTFQ